MPTTPGLHDYRLGKLLPKVITERLPAEVVSKVKRRIRAGTFGRMKWRAFVYLALIAAHALAMLAIQPHITGAIDPYRNPAWLFTLFPAVAGVTLVLLILAMWAIEHALARWRLKGALVSAGYCACCLTSMRDQSPQSDGCTVCPECGAAWRLDSGYSGQA